MTNYITRDEISLELQHAISLFAQREQIRRDLRVRVNKLTRSIDERRALYAELKENEFALTQQIEQLKPYLEPDDRLRLMQQYEPELVPG